jgi:hypothetical protein
MSCGARLKPASPVAPLVSAFSSSSPTSCALAWSGSSRFSLRSRKISTVWYGDDDQMTRSFGNEIVRRTIFERRSMSFGEEA